MSLLSRARATATHVFFVLFFRLLIAAASAAQWAVLAWIAVVGFGATLSWPINLFGIAVFYAVNRTLTRPSRRRRGGAALRVYTATAFISLFCAMFLLASWIVYGVADGVLGVLAAHAVGPAGQGAVAAGTGSAFRWIASLGMAAIGLVMGYGYVFGQHELRVTRTEVPVTGLGRPLRVAQISDIHVGQNLSRAQLEQFVAAVNATSPDLICITGDIADSPHSDLDEFFPLLAELQARHGVVAILGNHDHSAGADRVAEALRRYTPFIVLRDDAITLDIDAAPLHVIGLDDRGRDWARGLRADAQLDRLLAAAPTAVPRVLLSHRPDIFPQAASGDVVLTLSGHTHGGQLAVPWFGGRRRNLAEFITRFDRGLYRDGAAHLYVNAGLGVTGQRIRLWTPREISLFELAPVSGA
jgi:predicted MPP superfamily phosphohydrolase